MSVITLLCLNSCFAGAADVNGPSPPSEAMAIVDSGAIGSEKAAEQLREFLWRHWLTSSAGTMLIKSTTYEGVSNNTKYQIDIQKDGARKIIVTKKTQEIDFVRKSARNVERCFEFSNLIRIEPRKTVDAAYKQIPSNDRRGPNAYRLILRNSDSHDRIEI